MSEFISTAGGGVWVDLLTALGPAGVLILLVRPKTHQALITSLITLLVAVTVPLQSKRGKQAHKGYSQLLDTLREIEPPLEEPKRKRRK